ncbi:uncharacterized protein Tco025E_07439, partial [Trypanosoma conorhini]
MGKKNRNSLYEPPHDPFHAPARRRPLPRATANSKGGDAPRKRKSRRTPPGRAARRDPNRAVRATFARGREARGRGPAAFALGGPALSRGASRLACCVRLAASGVGRVGLHRGPLRRGASGPARVGRVKCAPRGTSS